MVGYITCTDKIRVRFPMSPVRFPQWVPESARRVEQEQDGLSDIFQIHCTLIVLSAKKIWVNKSNIILKASGKLLKKFLLSGSLQSSKSWSYRDADASRGQMSPSRTSQRNENSKITFFSIFKYSQESKRINISKYYFSYDWGQY